MSEPVWLLIMIGFINAAFIIAVKKHIYGKNRSDAIRFGSGFDIRGGIFSMRKENRVNFALGSGVGYLAGVTKYYIYCICIGCGPLVFAILKFILRVNCSFVSA